MMILLVDEGISMKPLEHHLPRGRLKELCSVSGEDWILPKNMKIVLLLGEYHNNRNYRKLRKRLGRWLGCPMCKQNSQNTITPTSLA
jgi:hypothetical protein